MSNKPKRWADCHSSDSETERKQSASSNRPQSQRGGARVDVAALAHMQSDMRRLFEEKMRAKQAVEARENAEKAERLAAKLKAIEERSEKTRRLSERKEMKP